MKNAFYLSLLFISVMAIAVFLEISDPCATTATCLERHPRVYVFVGGIAVPIEDCKRWGEPVLRDASACRAEQ